MTTVDTEPALAPAPPPPPPAPPGFFGDGWPAPSPAAGPATLIAVTAAGLAAAASLPLDKIGVGWLGTGVVMASSLLAVTLANRAPSFTPAVVVRLLWGLAALALLAVGTVRSAEWLFVLCLPAAVVAAVLALVGARTVQGIVGSLVLQPVAVLRALPWGARGLATLKGGGSGRNPARLGITVLVTVALLLVFGTLFASAEVGFAKLTEAIIPDLSEVFRRVFLFAAVGTLTLGGAYLVLSPPALDDPAPGTRRRLHRLEWTLPFAALVALFVAFVAVQLTVLFGGSDYVLRTSGLTYAEYARRGFWQLLVIIVLTLAVLAAAAHWAPRETAADRAWIRVLLGALALLTLVIVVSALYRMWVYEEVYGFTRLRVVVSAVELALGVVFLLILAAGVRLRGGWLPQAVLATGVLTLLGLAVLNPDRFITEQNVTRFERVGSIDIGYLREMSADAAPALYRLPDNKRACVQSTLQRRLDNDPDDWRSWNYGRATARHLFATSPVNANCE